MRGSSAASGRAAWTRMTIWVLARARVSCRSRAIAVRCAPRAAARSASIRSSCARK